MDMMKTKRLRDYGKDEENVFGAIRHVESTLGRSDLGEDLLMGSVPVCTSVYVLGNMVLDVYGHICDETTTFFLIRRGIRDYGKMDD